MPKFRLIPVALLALMIVIQPVWPAGADSAPDSTSTALTTYLHQNRLPAVGAQITVTPEGQQTVVLYGFVATPKGKSDAEIRTRSYLKDPSVAITNRIMIDPTLLASNKPGASGSQIDEYQNYGNPDSSSASGAAGGAPNVAPPPNVGSMQAYQSQNPVNDPLNQNNGLATGLMIIGPIIGGLLLYNALSGPSYNAPPQYYRPPPRNNNHGSHRGHR